MTGCRSCWICNVCPIGGFAKGCIKGDAELNDATATLAETTFSVMRVYGLLVSRRALTNEDLIKVLKK